MRCVHVYVCCVWKGGKNEDAASLHTSRLFLKELVSVWGRALALFSGRALAPPPLLSVSLATPRGEKSGGRLMLSANY